MAIRLILLPQSLDVLELLVAVRIMPRRSSFLRLPPSVLVLAQQLINDCHIHGDALILLLQLGNFSPCQMCLFHRIIHGIPSCMIHNHSQIGRVDTVDGVSGRFKPLFVSHPVVECGADGGQTHRLTRTPLI